MINTVSNLNSLNLTKRSILSLISFYQKHLSPRKGFSCAYRVFYKTDSCSNKIKTFFIENDLKTAYQLSRQQLKACKNALKMAKAEKNNIYSIDLNKPDDSTGKNDKSNNKKHEHNNKDNYILGLCEGSSFILDLSSCACELGACGL